MTETPVADFWFDPSCPLTWRTSRWLVEVAGRRPLEIRWHLLSLSVLNEGRDDDPEGDPHGHLWQPVRVAAAVEASFGQSGLSRFYASLWTADGASADRPTDPRTALADAGLPTALASAATSTDHDDTVRASHAEGIGLVGTDVGTPVLAVRGTGTRPIACFGPVITEVPTGDEAERLWDGTLLVAGTRSFRELRAGGS